MRLWGKGFSVGVRKRRSANRFFRADDFHYRTENRTNRRFRAVIIDEKGRFFDRFRPEGLFDKTEQ